MRPHLQATAGGGQPEGLSGHGVAVAACGDLADRLAVDRHVDGAAVGAAVVADLDRVEALAVVAGHQRHAVGGAGAAHDEAGQSERQGSVVRLVAREDLPLARLLGPHLVGSPIVDGRAGRQHAAAGVAEARLEECAQAAGEVLGLRMAVADLQDRQARQAAGLEIG